VNAGAARDAADSEIADVIAEAWRGREDRGAEERASRNHREAFLTIEDLRRDPHLEMHTRGG
jgi:cyclic pyranopterin phosphate synthase